MEDLFKIYIPHLREGKPEQICFEAEPGFMDLNEATLSFQKPVKISGEVYIASDELIFHLNAETIATIPCKICNDPVQVEIKNIGFYHTIPLAEVRSGDYYFNEAVRENLLMMSPDYVECHNGECPSRETIKKYFKNQGAGSDDEGQRPFANL